MKRAPLGHPSATQVMMEKPVLRQLTFAPLPLQTHPIDTYDGPQGWGPFNGAWTPWDWHDPAVHISDRYGSGESNEWEFAPPYDVITLFSDHSLSYVNNTSYALEVQRDKEEQDRAYTSTAANARAGRGQSVIARLREMLTGGGE